MGRAGHEINEASWVAWVRIHDGALTHPKLVGLSDKAFRLWVWGLSYCQQHLTDGHVPVAALPTTLRRAVPELTKSRLWKSADQGFTVHDFLDWNDDRDTVRKRQALAKDRLKRFRKRVSNASHNGVANASGGNGEPNQTEPNQT